MKDKKRIALIILIVIGLCIALILSYAVISQNFTAKYELTTGSLIIQELNFKIENKETGELVNQVTNWAPGDASIITWDVENIGTSAAFTRNTLKIYWDDEIATVDNPLIYLYPANMTNNEILEDFEGEKKYQIATESVLQDETGEKIGISYTFYGDTLEGTENKSVAQETNYDNSDFGTESFTTIEQEISKDKIAFRLLLNPHLSYLNQGSGLTIKIQTEAMQYTENGLEEWKVESEQEIEI